MTSQTQQPGLDAQQAMHLLECQASVSSSVSISGSRGPKESGSHDPRGSNNSVTGLRQYLDTHMVGTLQENQIARVPAGCRHGHEIYRTDWNISTATSVSASDLPWKRKDLGSCEKTADIQFVEFGFHTPGSNADSLTACCHARK